ncbi:MAG: twin-arginine translocase TatA/TatE family subunit [Bacteroidota bacterium]
MNLGFPELLLIGLVILVMFGPKKIPEIAQGLGKG